MVGEAEQKSGCGGGLASRFRKAAKEWVSRKTVMHSVHSRVSSVGWLHVIGGREGIMETDNLYGSGVVKLLHWLLYLFVASP